MTEVRGTRVLLRGFAPHEIDEAIRRIGGGLPLADDGQVLRRRERLERSGARNGWEVLFAIEAEGRLVGDAQGRSSDLALPPGVWEIGIELWDEADRGRGLGREAVGLLSSHLFEHEGATRVQATTDVDNDAMRRTLHGLGFSFEGVLRGFMPVPGGTPRDYAIYGITKVDWTTEKDGWHTQGAKDGWTRTS
jgi:RimJ/RimL family protein N-acetyltransferase